MGGASASSSATRAATVLGGPAGAGSRGARPGHRRRSGTRAQLLTGDPPPLACLLDQRPRQPGTPAVVSLRPACDRLAACTKAPWWLGRPRAWVGPAPHAGRAGGVPGAGWVLVSPSGGCWAVECPAAARCSVRRGAHWVLPCGCWSAARPVLAGAAHRKAHSTAAALTVHSDRAAAAGSIRA